VKEGIFDAKGTPKQARKLKQKYFSLTASLQVKKMRLCA
jgi:hypothetical protein